MLIILISCMSKFSEYTDAGYNVLEALTLLVENSTKLAWLFEYLNFKYSNPTRLPIFLMIK